ncbi:MAG: CocE/NonD family hydrolase [Bacteroidales bacterium]
MKKTLSILTVLLTVLIPCKLAAQNNIDYKSITGSWIGKIPAGGVSLRVIFNLSLAGKDSLASTMDSPDQGAKGIKVGPVKFDGKDLDIKAPALLGEYSGTLKSDTLIEGTWKQAGKTFDLNLSKLQGVFSLNRPQEPKPPFPYTAEDVTFRNDKFNITLAGTLTIPAGKGPFPAVIMITGSGAQNRDEELMGHKPFWIIADYLSRNGIAVLRTDDRGVGKSQGVYSTATTADLATDAEAAFMYLKNNSHINPHKIGLAGHSEGGIIAPIVASGNKDVAFIISIAGMGVKGEELLHRQNYDIGMASGAEEKDVQTGISTNKTLFAIVKKEKDNKLAEEKMTAAFKKVIVKEKLSREDSVKAMKQFQSQTGTLTSSWFRYFLTLDPSAYWKKVKCPVLILNGKKDLQVAADVNPPAIEKSLKTGKNNSYITHISPDLNHLFQHCKTGLPSEYGNIEETFSPEVLKIMSDWILAL